MFCCPSPRRAACTAGCWLGLSLLLAGPAGAQTLDPALRDAAHTLQASDARSPVPALPYRSVFADLPRGVEEGAKDWKAANRAVGQFPRGHIDLLQWEKARSAPTKEQP
jgi:hypothetical protein